MHALRQNAMTVNL